MFSPGYSEPEPARDAPLEDEFDPWLFIKNLPPLLNVQRENRTRRVYLPKKMKQAPEVCLALDLDETLVHCSVQPIVQPDLTFTVSFNGVDYQVYVRMRPYLKDFLKVVSQWFEIVVFTASQRVYADKLLSMLDPSGKYITHRMFRDSCLCVDGNYLKDLTVLGRDIRKVAIIDNSVQAFGYHLSNGIPIESWFDDDEDQELLKLLPFLNKLKDCADVRSLIRETFRLEEHLRTRFSLSL
jgi:CTD small phosphatase-like protein 2